MTHRYTIGGVAFLVDDELPDLPTTAFSDATLRVHFVDDPEGRPAQGSDFRSVAGPFDLTGTVNPDARECMLPALLVDPQDRAWQLRQMAPIFSAVLGRLVLHAGAVGSDLGVLGFVGESGAGKSTLAGFLADRGYPHVADDLLPVRFTPTATSPVGDQLSTLGALFFLSRTQTETVDLLRLAPLLALKGLVSNGFGEHGDQTTWRFQFDAYHRIAETRPVFNLTIPNDISSLQFVERAITDLVGGLLGSRAAI